MTRIDLLNAARNLAYEQIDMCSALSETEFAELKKLPEDKATEKLASEFLEEALDYDFGK